MELDFTLEESGFILSFKQEIDELPPEFISTLVRCETLISCAITPQELKFANREQRT